MAEPTHVRSFKKVFVQLYTPYSLKKREQANLRLSVFNYDSQEDEEVRKKHRGLLTFGKTRFNPIFQYVCNIGILVIKKISLETKSEKILTHLKLKTNCSAFLLLS